MNLLALETLPPDSPFWKTAEDDGRTFEARLGALRAAGFRGVQFADRPTRQQLAICRALPFGTAGSGRVNQPGDADAIAEQMADDGIAVATLHVGWGLESDEEAFRLIESVLEASARRRVALFVETHRATIFQDMWRSVQFVQRFPELRFNGDFSHWYAGQEMVYGGFECKLEFIQPVLDRVDFLHGRIANPGCIQVAVPRDENVKASYVSHFEQLWTRCFRGFLQRAAKSESIYFAPELLAPDIFYARTFEGREESNRWEQMLLLKEMAERCFACAQS